MSRSRWWVGGLLALAGAQAARAQSGSSFWVGATGTALRTRTALGGAITGLKGALVGGEGSLVTGRLALRLSYAEGSASAGAIHRDHVEGFLFVGLQPVRGLTLGGGPHAIAFTTDSSSERWIQWQVRARYEAPMIENLVRGYLEGWVAATGSAKAVGSFGGGRGGGAGLLIRLGRVPLVARLGYTIGEARLRAGARRETVEGLTIGLGYGR